MPLTCRCTHGGVCPASDSELCHRGLAAGPPLSPVRLWLSCREPGHTSDITQTRTLLSAHTAHCSNGSHTSLSTPGHSRTHTNNGEVDTLDSTRVRADGQHRPQHAQAILSKFSEIRNRAPHRRRHATAHSATPCANEEQRGGVLRGKRVRSPQVVTCPNLAPLLQALRREGHEDGLLLLPLLLPVLRRLPHEAARHERVLKLHSLGVRG